MHKNKELMKIFVCVCVCVAQACINSIKVVWGKRINLYMAKYGKQIESLESEMSAAYRL